MCGSVAALAAGDLDREGDCRAAHDHPLGAHRLCAAESGEPLGVDLDAGGDGVSHLVEPGDHLHARPGGKHDLDSHGRAD